MASKKKAGGAMSKADYVRNHAGKSAKEIVEAGAKDGVKLSIAHVYAVQSGDRQKAKKGATGSKKAGRPPGSKNKGTTPVTSRGDGRVRAFADAARALGIARAREILDLLDQLG